MTRGIQEMFDGLSDHAAIDAAFTVRWSWKGTGWGEYHFYIGDDGKLHIANETMSKDAIKHVLGMLVDEAELDDPR